MRWDKPVISLPSAEVFPGQFIAVVGPNGAGKSSLALSLMGLLRAEGTYMLCGEEVIQGKRRKVRKKRERRCAKSDSCFRIRSFNS